MIALSPLDYILIFGLFAVILSIGIGVSRRSGRSASEYFLSGRVMPWWLLGLSMVATTFSTDTPNLVTELVREKGVAGNWKWWAFLLTGLLTVFVYARLWRKSGVSTDIEFYELRYGGKPARFLRGFRALYLGVVFNVMAMAGVTLAAIKIGQVMLGLSDMEIVIYLSLVTVVFSALGGFKGVVYTDFILFFVAMAGAIGAAWYCVTLPEVGGLSKMMAHENVSGKLSLLPDFNDTQLVITLLVIPLAVQWWSSWYPGAEPGGGGYIAQRMLAAKDENHAVGATFFFNIMHYALRPWPWILVALASLVLYPDLASIREAFPGVSEDKLGHDLGYPAMLSQLPAGLMGLVLAALAAAYMSTISTHLNWGASYIVNDFYARYINPKASEKRLVRTGRLATVGLMVISAALALWLESAQQLFDIIILFGAGTGLIFILRWFWWRINAWSEIAAMFSSGIISAGIKLTPLGAILFGDAGLMPGWADIPFVVFITTAIWLTATFLTPPEKEGLLFAFCKKIRPGGPGWRQMIKKAEKQRVDIAENGEKWSVPTGILAMVAGCIAIYCALFATGHWIYGNYMTAVALTTVSVVSAILLQKNWQKFL